MQVEVTHHVDASEQAADGSYDYYYEYDMFLVSDGALSLGARSYTDTPDEAHFLNIESNQGNRRLTDPDVKHALFIEALAYLQAHGKTQINWLIGRGNGYEPVAVLT